jgi:AcrR family transcriptional regulator
MSTTRDRIITEALRLFAERGYRGTSVADLEKAAGLSPGSGSLYTHFRTKEDVLAAAVEQTAILADTGYAAFDLLPLGDLRAELTLIARGSLLVMDTCADLIRVIDKESDQFPGILADARARIFDRAYSWFSDMLRVKAKDGEIGEVDFDAVGAIWLGALKDYWGAKTILGEPPAGLDNDRFVAAWVDTLMRVLERPDQRGQVR